MIFTEGKVTSSERTVLFFWEGCWVFVAVGSSLLAVHRLLTAAASLMDTGSRARGLRGGSRALEHRLGRCGAWAQLLRGT